MHRFGMMNGSGMRLLSIALSCAALGGCGGNDDDVASNGTGGSGAGTGGKASGGAPGTGGASSGGTGGSSTGGSSGASGGAAGSSGGTSGGGGRGAGCPSPQCTLFVAPSGNDGNSGTETQPFASPQKAADVAQPGDTICLRAGSYTGGAKLGTSGTSAAPITLKSHPNETAVIDGGGVSFFAGWGQAVGHLVLEGVEITNVSGNAIYLHSAHDVVIRRNVVHDNPHQGILGNGVRVLVDGNVFARNGTDIDEEWCNPGCYNKHHAVYGEGGQWTVVNNVFHSTTAYGVQVAGYPWDPNDPNRPAGPEYTGADGWLISNNVFAFQMYRSGIVMWLPDTKNSVIQNNIFYQNGETAPWAGGVNGVDFYGSGGGHVVRNNLYSGSSQAIADTKSGASYTETGALSGDPKFVDASKFDFRLAAGSPALGAGTATTAPDHDADCAPRPQGDAIDLGAYEQ